jgi:hypothetical protein
VIVDPSHATGKRWLVKPLAIGGVAVGADGVMVEVHPTRTRRFRIREQQLDLEMFRDLMAAVVRSTSTSGSSITQRWSHDRVDHRRAAAARVRPSARLRGELRLPGDKSISHRALLFAALAEGESRSRAPVTVPTSGPRQGSLPRSAWTSRGGRMPVARSRTGWCRRGGWPARATDVLDCGNSGTSLRLVAACSRGCR